MAPSRKSRPEEKTCPPKTPMWMLPTDLLLDITARFDLRTLIRCAATCKLLRRDLLSPHFIHRVSQAAPCILAYLCLDSKRPLTLVHPTTPAALYFCHNHLSRFMSSKGVGILVGKYEPLSSRRGLVVLRRLNIKNGSKSDRCLDLCVYDPMSGTHTFFSNPPEIGSPKSYEHKYVILTAADGINCSLMLLVFDIYNWGVKVHTTSSHGTWEIVTFGISHHFPWWSLKKRRNPAILRGGIIHWLACHGEQILSYNFCTRKASSVKLPSTYCKVNFDASNFYLATSPDRKRLKLLAIQGFMMFVWLQLPASTAGGSGSGWSLETVIDMKEKMRSLDPNLIESSIKFDGSGKSTGDVVFLKTQDYGITRLVFDLETNKMHMQKREFSLLEIDLPSRLQTMKIFS